jgi:transcriptional regulator with XRE-family HTH domain
MSNIEVLADELFERFERRRIESQKRGRSEVGNGHPLVGAVLTGYREYQNLNKRQLAALTGLNHTFIGRIERGERGITVESLAKLHRALGDEFALEYLDAYDQHVNGYTAPDSGHRVSGRPEGLAGEQEIQEQPRSPHSGAESHDAPGTTVVHTGGHYPVEANSFNPLRGGPDVYFPDGE